MTTPVGHAHSWQFDGRGLSAALTVDGATLATFTHDPRGLPASKSLANGTTATYSYDAAGRLLSIGGSVPVTYTLNAVGTRTGRHDAAFAPEVYLHDAIDQRTGTAYHHRDGLMSTVALSDADGDIIERVRYDAFGLPAFTDADGLPLAESSVGNRFLFTGRDWLADVHLYDHRHRAYSPELGRFLQTDPIRFAAGDGNLYRYVTNAPGDWMDPWGLQMGRGNPENRKYFEDGLGKEYMEEQDRNNKEMIDEASDVAKEGMLAPIPGLGWLGRLIKQLIEKAWKEHDPGEEFPDNPC